MNRHVLSPRMLLGLVVAAPAAIAVLPQATLAQAIAVFHASESVDTTVVSAVSGSAIAPGATATYGRLQVTTTSQAITPHAQALGYSLSQTANPDEWREMSQRDYDADHNNDRSNDRDFDHASGHRRWGRG